MNILLDILRLIKVRFYGKIKKSLITRTVLDEKILFYSVLKSPRGKLQEYIMKNEGFRFRI